jgi:predicted RecB family nuclease
MRSSHPYLTKSSYVRGVECQRMLWRSWHRRLPYEQPAAGSPAAVGTEIGLNAHHLFPGGVLVDEEPWQHDEAVARTRDLMADPLVPAIFEAAYEFDGVRIRVDVMERLPDGTWALGEVKSASKVKARYIDDIAVQAYVVAQSGVELASTELVRVNTAYVFGGGEIDWQQFFKRDDVGAKVRADLPSLAATIKSQLAILHRQDEPDIAPGPHCPSGCDFWAHCTADKPDDWIFNLPRVSRKKFAALREEGIERIRDIPADFDLTDHQDRMRDVLVKGRAYISSGLGHAMAGIVGAVAYLDFEAMNPAIPIYFGTRPYQRIAFQWSLHRHDGGGNLSHSDFLADPRHDPREPFTTTLIAALEGSSEPIVVYSSYERSVLAELAQLFPEHASALEQIIARLVDLYVIVRNHVYLPGFAGSFSIKTVGKALAPGFSYRGLEHVADGAQAATAFQRMAFGAVDDEVALELRRALLAYCRLDTLAMVEAHRGLRRLADEAAE